MTDGPVAFTVSGRAVSWDEVISHARATGAWDVLEREVSEGARLLRTPGVASPGPGELRRAAADFRYARGLVAAEELEAWLGRWRLTVEDWTDHLRRTLVRQAHLGEIPATEPPLTAAELEARTWSSAVCSGTFARAARDLAEVLAIVNSFARDRGTVVEMGDARTQLARRVVTEEALAAQVQRRVLDWVRIDSEVLTFGQQDAAREALLVLRDEGLSTAEVADLARAGLERRIDYLEDVAEELRQALTGAAPGDILGPFEQDGLFRVIVVHEKAAPLLSDGEVRRRAEATVVQRAIRRETDERVVGLGAL